MSSREASCTVEKALCVVGKALCDQEMYFMVQCGAYNMVPIGVCLHTV